MNIVEKIFGKLYFGAALTALFSVTAFAYLDPGTLSYVISMVAGLVIAGGAALAIFRRKIKLFFQNLGKKNAQDSGAPAQKDQLGDQVDPMEIDPLADDK